MGPVHRAERPCALWTDEQVKRAVHRREARVERSGEGRRRRLRRTRWQTMDDVRGVLHRAQARAPPSSRGQRPWCSSTGCRPRTRARWHAARRSTASSRGPPAETTRARSRPTRRSRRGPSARRCWPRRPVARRARRGSEAVSRRSRGDGARRRPRRSRPRREPHPTHPTPHPPRRHPSPGDRHRPAPRRAPCSMRTRTPPRPPHSTRTTACCVRTMIFGGSEPERAKTLRVYYHTALLAPAPLSGPKRKDRASWVARCSSWASE